MIREIVMDKNMLELNPQGDHAFPFNCMHISLLDYPTGSFPYHWHPEIEITFILKGTMTYQVNQSSFLLKQDDCVFVNQNSLHAGSAYEASDCEYVCFMFNPSMVYGFEHSTLYTQYVAPILETRQFDHAIFQKGSQGYAEIRHFCERLLQSYTLQEECYHLHIQSSVCEIWSHVFHQFSQFIQGNRLAHNPAEAKRISHLKEALSYIYQNYTLPVTLDEIAEACHMSKSRFCRIFKESFHQTPFDFLLRYRIEKSLPLLCDNSLSITEVATAVGFSAPSYYAEVFRKYMRCSPTAYRREHAARASQNNGKEYIG